ncbi:hypothetical protein EZV62_011915 [Acer yangbiense]|uniref:F-box domain-containing protein n=1 Tax=Acer yangbiense TaxID=1000413 RepID=A0A5C7I6M4_9ROSI|nr:hypothetical protein EZV62_011915 [Acer yangbiense]
MASSCPPDLIIDILLYLPGKSLCRFKCVSKSWSILITHPRFVKLHLARNQRGKFLLFNVKSLCHLDPETSLLQQEPTSSYRNFRFWPSISWVSVSSNGLFCTQMFSPPDDDFYIYNPSTREYKKILYMESEKESNSRMFFNLHGFGYVESMDDYKFVKVDIQTRIIQIFSLRNNSWKTIKCDFPFNHINCFANGLRQWKYGIPLNGAIHWVVYYYDGGHNFPRIVAFDLVKEKFKTFPQHDKVFPKLSQLTVLRDCLCIINSDDKFWIMEKYGTKESWTKIALPNKCSWKDSEFLFGNLDDDGWLKSDDNHTGFVGNKWYYYKPVFIGKEQYYNKRVYIENLVSLNFHTNNAVANEGINNFT